MPFAENKNHPPFILIMFFLTSSVVVSIAALRGYSFIPNRNTDGFLSQIEHARVLMEANSIGPFVANPLSMIHALRYLIVSPFLASEQLFGPAGSMALLQLLFWPLLLIFSRQRGDWSYVVLLCARLIILALPLAVSGRTVLVAAGMGYLVSGIIMRPFSGWRMLVGCAVAVLSSASIMFSIAVLVFSGNWKGRSRVFYAVKFFFIIFLFILFVPSLLAKSEGFSSGTSGYAYETDEQDLAVQDTIGSGPFAAVERVLLRSTVAESYRRGRYARIALYLVLFGAAWTYIIWSAVTRRWHPLLVVLGILSTGIFLEGLALWPVLLPIVWVYTGKIAVNDDLVKRRIDCPT